MFQNSLSLFSFVAKTQIFGALQTQPAAIYWVIQNDCGQVWQICTKIYVATVWIG
jgi:hypothetical protein